MKKSSLIFCLFICSFFFVFTAQGQSSTFSPTGSFSLDLGVPAKPQNPAFEHTMEGLLNAGLDYRYNVYRGLTVGLGLKYTFFTLNSFAFSNTAISGGMQSPGAYAVVGYEKFTTERISFTGSLRGGYSLLMNFNDSCRVKLGGQHISESFFVEPQIEMAMLTDKVSEHAFSMIIGYSFYFHNFSNEDLCMNNISSLFPEDYEGVTRYLSIGFGYRYYMGRR
ncbi:MAG: hypothetical protein GQ574_08585 [Crocinitomix sp.]|nr:hypothetical protein [Crocinitomix sp.]